MNDFLWGINEFLGLKYKKWKKLAFWCHTLNFFPQIVNNHKKNNFLLYRGFIHLVDFLNIHNSNYCSLQLSIMCLDNLIKSINHQTLTKIPLFLDEKFLKSAFIFILPTLKFFLSSWKIKMSDWKQESNIFNYS